jgi:hypothetical protein
VIAIAATGLFAIIGQCGTQCSVVSAVLFQQRDTAAAGPASSPKSSSNATNLAGMLTRRTYLILLDQNPNAYDCGHTYP